MNKSAQMDSRKVVSTGYLVESDVRRNSGKVKRGCPPALLPLMSLVVLVGMGLQCVQKRKLCGELMPYELFWIQDTGCSLVFMQVLTPTTKERPSRSRLLRGGSSGAEKLQSFTTTPSSIQCYSNFQLRAHHMRMSER